MFQPLAQQPGRYPQGSRGLTFIDVVVGVALALLVFTGLFGAFRLSIEMISLSKGRSGAMALANERIEYVRSLPYASVGTAGGIPSGAIAQTEVIPLNQTDYTRRTLILYADDPHDGLGAADLNGITTDYKYVKVEVTWDNRGRAESTFLVTNVVPRGIETTAGGGTIRVAVIDAAAQPVAGASVRVANPGMVPAVDTTVYTNVNGEVLIGGAPAGSGFEVTVSKSGFSTAQTYGATVQNPNPTPGHLSVTAGNTTTGTFAIDAYAAKTVRTLSPVTHATFTDPFLDAALVAEASSTNVSAGALRLNDTAGIYDAYGTARSDSVTDAYLYRWDAARFDATTPGGTVAAVKVYYDTGSGFAPIPDADLPGNGAGFTASPISLASVSTTTYPSLALFAELSTSDALATPSIESWEVSYRVGPVPVPNVSFTMRGTKTIGTRADSTLIYKYETATSTDASGARAFPELEWDTYDIDVTEAGYDVAESCLPQPRAIAAGADAATNLFLVPDAADTLLVAVFSDAGDPIEGAGVSLSGPGYSGTAFSGECGQAFFTPLSANDFDLSVTAPGFQAASSTVSVFGDTEVQFNLTP